MAQASTDPRDQTGQIPLWWLFLATGVVALVLAVVGPRVRHWPVQVQWMMAANVIPFGLIAVLFVGVLIRRRRRHRLEGGPVVLAFLPLSRFSLAFSIFCAINSAIYFFAFDAILATGKPVNQPWLPPFLISITAFASLQHLSLLWAPTEFRERGVVVHGLFVPWADLKRYAWGPRPGQLVVILKQQHLPPVFVPEPLRERVGALLDERIAAQG